MRPSNASYICGQKHCQKNSARSQLKIYNWTNSLSHYSIWIHSDFDNQKSGSLSQFLRHFMSLLTIQEPVRSDLNRLKNWLLKLVLKMFSVIPDLENKLGVKKFLRTSLRSCFLRRFICSSKLVQTRSLSKIGNELGTVWSILRTGLSDSDDPSGESPVVEHRRECPVCAQFSGLSRQFDWTFLQYPHA